MTSPDIDRYVQLCHSYAVASGRYTACPCRATKAERVKARLRMRWWRWSVLS